MLWLVSVGGIAALALAGAGDIAFDFLPVVINLALCAVFARTLVPGSEPLIARLIGVIEGPARVALPRVAGYARALTWVWAVLLGVQAVLLAVLILCAVPDGLLARFGIAPPIAIGGDWHWYLNFGGYAGALACFVVEYAFPALVSAPHSARVAASVHGPARAPLARARAKRHARSARTGARMSAITETLAHRADAPGLAGPFSRQSDRARRRAARSRCRRAREERRAARAHRRRQVHDAAEARRGGQLAIARDGARVSFRIDRDGTPILRGEGELA